MYTCINKMQKNCIKKTIKRNILTTYVSSLSYNRNAIANRLDDNVFWIIEQWVILYLMHGCWRDPSNRTMSINFNGNQCAGRLRGQSQETVGLVWSCTDSRPKLIIRQRNLPGIHSIQYLVGQPPHTGHPIQWWVGQLALPGRMIELFMLQPPRTAIRLNGGRCNRPSPRYTIQWREG